jgi:arginyl-tRNA synthetase
MISQQIKKDLGKVCQKLKINPSKLVLEHPADSQHGDYATNIALRCWQKEYHSPFDLATKIVNTWRSEGLPAYLAKIEVAKPGFINLWLERDFLISQIDEVIKKKYLKTTAKEKKGIMVEFAHPNTHKQFHIGHLRNICLGEAVCRLIKANRNQIYRVNYQGDVGLHVAKCLWGLLKLKKSNPRSLDKKIELLGKAYVVGNRAYETEEKAKGEMEILNQKIYRQDKEILPLWKETRSWSLDYFDQIYQRLGVQFDRLYFESQVAEEGKKIVLQNLKKKIFEQSEGAVIFPGEKYGLHNRVFINQKGLPTYEAKDIALAQKQFADFSPLKIVHVVGPEQKGYFEVVFKALEKIYPKTAGKEFHLMYGWVRLKKGKMSSRTGEVVLGEWLLDEIKRRLTKDFKMTEKVLEEVAVGAVKYSMLKFGSQSEIVFDIDESVNLEGDSGPYLQYTYARTQSVLRKSGRVEEFKSKKIFSTLLFLGVSSRSELSSSFTLQEEEISILRTLYRFPEVVEQAGEKLAPNLICSFLFDLAQKYNLFYNRHSILKADSQSLIQFRLALTMAVGHIIKTGLNLLGIATPERM